MENTIIKSKRRNGISYLDFLYFKETWHQINDQSRNHCKNNNFAIVTLMLI